MHDLEIRIVSTLLFSGVLLFAAFVFYSLLYPEAAMASPSTQPATAVAQARDYGYFAPVARPVEWTLRQIQSRITYRAGKSSWGWAIVLATCLLRLLLLPFRILAARSAKSMRLLQPEMAVIRQKPQSDQPSALSDLYRKHSLHPLGGCLAGAVPFAVFAAFYSVLNKLPELHGASWLWIADLSRPEQLPVRVLPLLMIGTQLFMGRITRNPAIDQKTNRILTFVPLIFGIFLYSQPSALMLYWLTSNVLTIVQQYWLKKRYAH